MMNRRIKRQRGQSMVEFALVIPILLILVIAFLDLGRAVYTQSVLANAAREGTRTAVIRTNSVGAIRAAVKANAIGVTVSDSDITIDPESRTAGRPVSVSVTTRFYAITPFVAQLMNDGAGYIDLSSIATMTAE